MILEFQCVMYNKARLRFNSNQKHTFMCLQSRNKIDYIKHRNAWIPKLYLVNKVGHNSFWIHKHYIYYLNIDLIKNHVKPRKQIIKSSNLWGVRHNMKFRFDKTNRIKLGELSLTKLDLLLNLPEDSYIFVSLNYFIYIYLFTLCFCFI